MFSHNSYFLLWWTLYFVLPDNMNLIQVDASSASSSSSSSATSPLSGVVNIVGRRREVSRSTLDDASFDDVTINDINDNISGVQQEQQQRICACQPSWYTLRLNRSLDCDDRTIFTNRQAGIQSVMCTHPQDKTANALTAISSSDGRPFVPTRIDTVIIQELDMRGKVLKQETMHGPFADGTEITYISILATTATTASPSSATLQKNSKQASHGSHHHQTTTTTPSPSPSIQNDLINNNIKGDEHHNNNNNNLPVRLEIKFLGYPGGSVWSMAYSQDCLGGPILEKGHTIVRAVLSDVGIPAAGYCPVGRPDEAAAVPTSMDGEKKTTTTAKRNPSTRVTSTLLSRRPSTIPMVFVMASTKTTNSTNNLMSVPQQHDAAAHAVTSSFQKLLQLRPVRDLIILTRR